MKAQNTDSGFTLLEMMVAISILAIVLVAVYKLQAQSIMMNHTARFYTIAPLLAQQKTSELETKSVRELSGGSGDFGDKFPGYNWTVTVEDVQSEVLGDTGKNLKKIDVSISNTEMTYRFRTYRFVEDKG